MSKKDKAIVAETLRGRTTSEYRDMAIGLVLTELERQRPNLEAALWKAQQELNRLERTELVYGFLKEMFADMTAEDSERREMFASYYFKDDGSGDEYMSGLPLPKDEDGVVRNKVFVFCDFHFFCSSEKIRFENCLFFDCNNQEALRADENSIGYVTMKVDRTGRWELAAIQYKTDGKRMILEPITAEMPA
jgi:hypothetical protein